MTSTAKLEQLLDAACVLFSADRAAVVLTMGSIERCIAGRGLVWSKSTRVRNRGDTSYSPDKTILVQGSSAHRYARELLSVFQIKNAGLLIRKPIEVAPNCSAAIHIATLTDQAVPKSATMRVLGEICRAIAVELAPTIKVITELGSIVALQEPLGTLIDEVRNSPDARLLVDHRLSAIVMSDSLAKLTATNTELLDKSPIRNLNLPAIEALTPLLNEALISNCSTPEIEVAFTTEGRRRHYLALGTPLRPKGSVNNVLDLSLREVKDQNQDEMMAFQLDHVGHADGALDPTSRFLLDTLPHKRAIRSRKGVSYITLRSWRSPIRDHQIAALKALKSQVPRPFVNFVSREIAHEIRMLVGRNSFKYIVPIPCGHSPATSCLSEKIARAVSGELGIAVLRPFANEKLQGSSHPKTNMSRPSMRLIEPVKGEILLVDDVATSGAHIHEAVTLLQKQGASVFAIAWIGGEATSKED